MAEAVGEQKSACPHELAIGTRWGDPIPEERQAKLQGWLDAWAAETDHGLRNGPFDGVSLSGADLGWLADRVRDPVIRPGISGEVPNLHTEGAKLTGAHLEGAKLRRAHLERADLVEAHLEGAVLLQVHLEGARLSHAHLEGAKLGEAHLEGAKLDGAHLERADLVEAHLEEAALGGAHLEWTFLWKAHLEGAFLWKAHLEGAVLSRAYLDHSTDLDGIVFSDTSSWLASIAHFVRRQRRFGSVKLADVRWNGVDLTVVDWSGLRTLGDERRRYLWWRGREDSETAMRANIQLAKQLDNAGLKDDADRFFYRAQVCRRGVQLLRFHPLRWLFSWLLFAVAGYGYKPMRSVITYLLVITVFAAAFFGLGIDYTHPLSWNEALVVSLTAFHGRGFFATAFSPGDPQAAVAAIEAVIGLLIEITFIATFTQRFFAR